MIARSLSPVLSASFTETRLLRLILVVFVAFASYWLVGHFVGAGNSGSESMLIGRALLGASGKMDVGEMIAAYPPLGILPLITLHDVLGLDGLTTSRILSAALVGGLAGAWFESFVRGGYSAWSALLLTLLLAFNPLFLHAVSEGPDTALTLWGTWAFAIGIFSLRHRGSVNDVMLCSAALALLAFSGPVGAVFAAASLPFLAMAVPGDIRRGNYADVYLVLLFPVLFGFGGFILVNWMMLHDPFAFLRDLEMAHVWDTGDWSAVALEIVSTVACVPILLALFILSRGRRSIQASAFALLGTAMLATVAAIRTGAGGSITAALAPVVPIAAAAAMRLPLHEARVRHAALLLALGMAGAGSIMLAESRAWPRQLPESSPIDADQVIARAAEQEAGRFLAGRTGVLMDAQSHPRLIAARGSARGLVTDTDVAFTLSILRRRIETSAVVVQAPDPSRNADLINRTFPDLYSQGVPGFRLAYDRGGWRVWERERPRKAYP